MVSDTKAVKSVGEFWTCCKLAMNGWAPALTRDGLERTDILAEATLLLMSRKLACRSKLPAMKDGR